jgi:hypothetical protein
MIDVERKSECLAICRDLCKDADVFLALSVVWQHAPEGVSMDLNDVVAAAVELLAYALHVDHIEVDCHLAAGR